MYKIEFELKGTTDLLFSKYIEKPLKKATEEQYKKEAIEHKTHRNGAGCVVPADGFWKALQRGGNFTELKHNKKKLNTWIDAMVRVLGDLPLDPPDPQYVHKHPANNKYSGLVMNYRPAWKEGWKTHGTLLVLMDTLSFDDLRAAADMAGVMNGLGSWRSKYGRFEVIKWKKV